ncbi:MAG: P-loop ATPase, Sll1717 family [Methylobacter sp.]
MLTPIKLKKGLKLGELDAEADAELLKACFMDNGTLSRLLDIKDRASIILGRTGSGKSALLLQVKERSEHSCLLSPHDISIRFLENSNIIQFLSELGIKLDLFYKILWRHILIVELLKMRYNLHNEGDCNGFITSLYTKISRDKAKKKAFDYFSELGDKFWLEVDEQLIELTEKFTRDIKSELGGKFSEVDISLEGAKSLSNEQRTEIKPRASQVVSGIQIKRLDEVFNLLAEYAFGDKQKNYYLLIDQLDEDWAETETRYRFIRALIEEIKLFRNLPQVKIIVAMRQDLLEIVFDRTRDAGFQEEKYEAYLLPLKWTKNELEQLIELRINEVFKRQYTKDNVKFSDIFPNKKNHDKTATEYLVSRTLLRPRDILQYANECFVISSGNERVSWTSIYKAETIYSYKRLNSLQEEWGNIYPALKETINILRGLSYSFIRSDISDEKILNICTSLDDMNSQDPCVKACKKLCSPEENVTEFDVLSEILRCFYHVGIIGIKISKLDSCIWSYIDQPRISKSDIKRANQIKIHKMLHHTLEVKAVP